MTPQILDWLWGAYKVVATKSTPLRDVLEVGSYDVNGSPRDIFQWPETRYVGVDQSAGPGVDRVLKCHEIPAHFPPESFNLVISCEMLEHDPNPLESVRVMRSMLRPGGYLILTSPANGFPLHRYPRDYFRFMPDAYEDIFLAGMEIVAKAETSDPCLCYLARKT